jgi:DNA mismatch repair protein MutL
VHPTKKEVRFRRSDWVRDALIAALKAALSTGGAPSRSSAEAGTPPAGQRWEEPVLHIDNLPPVRPFPYPRMPMTPPAAGAPLERAPETGSGVTSPEDEGPWAWCRVIGQVGGLFVVLETEDGLVLMDPHAAHERVLFERFMTQVEQSEVPSQGLLSPEAVELSPREAQFVASQLDVLRAMGFGVSEFGGETFIVDAVPACLGAVSGEALLAELAETMERGGAGAGKRHAAVERIAQAACKAAVKARDRLRLEEIEQLVVDLAKAEMPYTCPHGRPTLIFMSFDELERKFGRA